MPDSFVTPWTVAHQAPLSMGFSRQEYWSGLPFTSSGDLPDPGIEPRSLAWWTDSLPSEPQVFIFFKNLNSSHRFLGIDLFMEGLGIWE